MGVSGPFIISLLNQNSFFQLAMLPLQHRMNREDTVQFPDMSRASRCFLLLLFLKMRRTLRKPRVASVEAGLAQFEIPF